MIYINSYCPADTDMKYFHSMINHTDIKSDDWIDRRVPAGLRPYARLMRLDRPIGTWLLVLPCWWSVALASPKFPDLWPMFLFALGSIVMRGAGCAVNDIYDRKLDAQVERTRLRPLASGAIKLWQAVVFVIILMLIGLGILACFNRTTMIIGVASLGLVFAYPLMKRITWWPQLFLGFTFNWGILMGWSAVTGVFGTITIPLYIAGVFWTLGYDTIYAHQDIRDDEEIGIKSTARLFGAQSKRWVALFYAVAVVLMALTGWMAGLGQGFYALLILAAGFAVVQILAWDMENPQDCLQRFWANRDFGLIIFVGLMLGKL